MPTICKEQGCSQPISSRETQLCHKHHYRLLRKGTTELSRPVVNHSKKCKVDGCERHQQSAIETCLMHYKRWKRYGVFEIPKRINQSEIECKFCNKKIGRSGAIGLCSKHYQMWKLHGDPLFTEEKRLNVGSRGYYRNTDGVEFHRRVIEEQLGRKLIKGIEVVHHIDLDKLNNNPSNLQVLTKKEHATAHQQLNQVAGRLIRVGIIIYKDGKYCINV